MAKFKTKEVTINGIRRSVAEVIDELWNICRSQTKERAFPILAELQQRIASNDQALRDECCRILTYLSAPTSDQTENCSDSAGNESNMPYIPDDDYIPYDDNVQPKTSHPPRRFVIAENHKERMLQFLHLAWKHKWFISRGEDRTTSLSQADVYYWFGRLLGYDFNKATSMLNKLYKMNRRNALAQEFYDFANELRTMTESVVNSTKKNQ